MTSRSKDICQPREFPKLRPICIMCCISYN